MRGLGIRGSVEFAARHPPTRAAFINMTEDCTVRGFTIFYPDNIPDAAPAPYPWTIGMQGNNNAVQVR